jgi:hypothetical protein
LAIFSFLILNIIITILSRSYYPLAIFSFLIITQSFLPAISLCRRDDFFHIHPRPGVMAVRGGGPRRRGRPDLQLQATLLNFPCCLDVSLLWAPCWCPGRL